MTNSVGSSQNVALQPVAARPVEQTQEVVRSADDAQRAEQVEVVQEAGEAEGAGARADDRGRGVDRYA